MSEGASQPTWREKYRNGSNGDGMNVPRWFLSLQGIFMPLAVAWGAWTTNAIYKVQAQTEGFAPHVSYVQQRLDRLSDQIRESERRLDRMGAARKGPE